MLKSNTNIEEKISGSLGMKKRSTEKKLKILDINSKQFDEVIA